MISERTEPDGEENVFEGDVVVMSARAGDPLFIAADVLPDGLADGGRHDFLGSLETVLKVDTVALGAESA